MKSRWILGLSLTSMCLSSNVLAQRVELQPFAGYRFGGAIDSDDSKASGFDIHDAGSYGLTIGMPVNTNGQLDILWSHQDTSLDVKGSIPGRGQKLPGFDVDYFQLEGSYIHGLAEDRVRPFVAFGAGVTHFGAPSGFSGSKTQLAFSVGGGARVSLGKRGGLRFQGRWTPTLYGSNETIFCSSGGGCYATVEGGLVSQIEVTAGVILRF